MTRVHRLMALLSLSRNFAPALGHVNRDYGYGDQSLSQPTVTATLTTTAVSTVTVDGSICDTLYIPTTVTVYTDCSFTLDPSSVSGLPLGSYSSQGPWTNITSAPDAPCTHDFPISSVVPSNFSSTLGWNHTTVTSLPTLTGTSGTTIETADPIGTSSAHWTNSTRSSTAEEDWTSVLTLTVTSSAMVTVNATVTSGYSAPSGFSTGTGLPGHSPSDIPTSYHPSLTYQTTTRAPSSATTPHTSTNGSATRSWSSLPTHTWSLPPSWNTSTISGTPTNTTSHSIITTETNDPLFTTATSSIPAWTNTTTTPSWTSTPTSLTTSSSITSTTNGDDTGGQYGSYTYPSPSLSSTNASSVASVDPIGGTATFTRTDTASVSIPTTLLTTSKPAGGSSAEVVSTASRAGGGGGYGYGYGGY